MGVSEFKVRVLHWLYISNSSLTFQERAYHNNYMELDAVSYHLVFTITTAILNHGESRVVKVVGRMPYRIFLFHSLSH